MGVKQVIVTVGSLAASMLVAVQAYNDPLKLVELAPTLATITSILIAVSLAVTAIVSAPFKVDIDSGKLDGRNSRVQSVLENDEVSVAYAQAILFYLYLFSLGSTLILWWVADIDAPKQDDVAKILAAIVGFSFSFSFCLSSLLPSLLLSIIRTRRNLG